MNENVIQKLTRAEQWLAEAKGLDDLKQIHDIAIAADAYAKAHRLGLNAENHAMEIRLLAARKIGELVPKPTPQESGEKGGRGKKASEVRNPLVSPQRLTEFRKLTEIPMPEFKKRIEHLKEREEKITYNRMLRGDWYQSSESPEWETPQWLFDILDKEFHFDLDVCASEHNYKCEKYFSKKEDGLKQKWQGICWMNPPYGREIVEWVEKAKKESLNGVTVVCLVPARTDTDWWWENCIQAQIRFIKGRLKFSGQGGAPMASAIVILSKKTKPQVIWWDIKLNAI